MRHLRHRLRIVGLTAPILLLAASASATQIDFVWAETGSKHITVLPGAEIVLEARVTVGEGGVAAVGVSSLAPVGLLEAIAFDVCPAGTGNAFGAGVCGSDPAETLQPAGLSTVRLNDQDAGVGSLGIPFPGLSGSFIAITAPGGGLSEGTIFALAHITYAVVGLGSGEVLPYYREGVDGAVEIGSSFFIPLADGADFTSGLSLRVIPEPGSFALLAGGLLLLAARRARR